MRSAVQTLYICRKVGSFLPLVSSLQYRTLTNCMNWFLIYLGFYVAFNTVQILSRRVVGRAEETSTYSLLGFCTVNCRPTVSNYQLSHLRPCWGSNPGLRGGRRECYHSATVAPELVSSAHKTTHRDMTCTVLKVT